MAENPKGDKPALADIAAKLTALPERIARWAARHYPPASLRGGAAVGASLPAPALPPAPSRPAREFSLGSPPVPPPAPPPPRTGRADAPDVSQDESPDLFGHTHRLLSAAAPFSPTLGRVGGLLGRIDAKRKQAMNLHAAFRQWQSSFERTRAAKDAPRVREGAESADLSRTPPLPRITPESPEGGTRGEARHAPPVLLSEPPAPAARPSAPPVLPPPPLRPARPAPSPPSRVTPPAPPAGGPAAPPPLGGDAPPLPRPTFPPLSALSGIPDALGGPRRPPLGSTFGRPTPPPFAGAQFQAGGGQGAGNAQRAGQGGSQSTKVMEDRLADIKDLLAKMLGGQEGHGATAISSLVQGQGQGGQRRISFGQGQGFGQQGRKRSADDAEGLKWSRRAGAFAGEFVKTLVEA